MLAFAVAQQWQTLGGTTDLQRTDDAQLQTDITLIGVKLLDRLPARLSRLSLSAQ